MKIYDIPAYAYFAGSSYRTDIFYVCDDALLATYDTLFPDSYAHTIWTESGADNYVNVWRTANQKLGAPVFSPNHRVYQVWNSNTVAPPSWYSRVISDFGITLDDIKITDSYTIPSVASNTVEPDSLVALNGDVLGHGYYHLGNIKWNTGFAMGSNTVYNRCYFSTSLNSVTVNIEVCIYPEGLFKNGVIIDQTTFESDYPTVLKVFLSGVYSVDGANLDKLKSFQVRVQHQAQRNSYNSLKNLLVNFHTANSGMTEKDFDDDNPYGTDGNSDIGGGDGTLPYGGLDYVDPAEIPEVPTLGAASCGFMTIYNPDVSALQA